ncbi:MAG: hypothetical protein EBY86_06395 [Acidimicrobiia bacterium]|nr:hypothetical protein [Acidimicrobiia bacterium]
MTEPLLDGVALHRAFSLVAERLQRKGVVGEIHIFGGAAMVLVFRSRLATRDVDAVFTPDGAVRDADDIRVLIVHLNMLSLSEIRAVVRRYFPDEPLSARSLELVSDILREVRGVVDGR